MSSEGSSDSKRAAKSAGLRFVDEFSPGIRRIRRGRGFAYLTARGGLLRDGRALRRILGLAIPPGWSEVWICPWPRGHIQAVGRDARRRKQYLYHSRWRQVRDESKYADLLGFACALPTIRRRVARHLSLKGIPREKVLATVVRLLELTLMRIGNEEYARSNHSFGMTTLRDHHIDVSGTAIEFQFRGKSGVHHSVEVSDPRLARIVKSCQDIPGQRLFQYFDEAGKPQSIDSGAVNAYLREIAGMDVTAKSFRTWAGTVLALGMMHRKKWALSEVVKRVAAELGNTVAVCRKCYIHPALLECYEQGVLHRMIPANGSDELLTLAFLKRITGRSRNGRAPTKGAKR